MAVGRIMMGGLILVVTTRENLMLEGLRKFHQKHENWWMIVLAVVAVVGLLFFAGALSGP